MGERNRKGTETHSRTDQGKLLFVGWPHCGYISSG